MGKVCWLPANLTYEDHHRTIKVVPPSADSFQEFMHLIDYLQVNGYEYTIHSDEALGPGEKTSLTTTPRALLT